MERYILWVTKKDGEGYSSHWYGWSKNLVMGYEEAVKKKNAIEHLFFDVEIAKI